LSAIDALDEKEEHGQLCSTRCAIYHGDHWSLRARRGVSGLYGGPAHWRWPVDERFGIGQRETTPEMGEPFVFMS
jgi:hypothetical protein